MCVLPSVLRFPDVAGRICDAFFSIIETVFDRILKFKVNNDRTKLSSASEFHSEFKDK